MTEEELLNAFMDAGVPKRLAKEGKLSDLPNTKQLLAFIQGMDGITEAMAAGGTCVVLEGEDEVCDDAIYYLVKSAVARAVEARVYTVVELEKELIYSHYTEDTDFWDAEIVAISGFEDLHYSENPFPIQTRTHLEDAIRRYINFGGSVVVHHHEGCEWWSTRLLGTIMRNCERFVL